MRSADSTVFGGGFLEGGNLGSQRSPLHRPVAGPFLGGVLDLRKTALQPGSRRLCLGALSAQLLDLQNGNAHRHPMNLTGMPIQGSNEIAALQRLD